MDDVVHTLHGAFKPVEVANVAEEEPQPFLFLRRELLFHLELLELITAVHDDGRTRAGLKNQPRELAPQRSSAAGDEDPGVC